MSPKQRRAKWETQFANWSLQAPDHRPPDYDQFAAAFCSEFPDVPACDQTPPSLEETASVLALLIPVGFEARLGEEILAAAVGEGVAAGAAGAAGVGARAAASAAAEGASEASRLGRSGGAGGTVLYHGSNIDSLLDILNNGLNAGKAAANYTDGPGGFFLATHVGDAEFFAVRNGRGAVINFSVSDSAMASLKESGASMRPIARGPKSPEFEGAEFHVPASSFELFNRLRERGEILVSP
jgi:hypothetical protein